MAQTCTDTYTECACPHAYMSVFLKFFSLWGSIHANIPKQRAFSANTQLHRAVSHKEASHMIHWERTCIKLQQDIFWGQTQKVWCAQQQRFTASSVDESEGALSHWPFHLGNSKISVREPQDLPRNATKNYLETSPLSSCMRKWSPWEIKAFCSGFTSGRLNNESKSIFFDSQGNDYSVGPGWGSTPTLRVADTNEMV